MYLFLLLFILIVYLLIQLNITNNDIFYPSIIVTGSFIFALIFALSVIETWQISISQSTFFILFTGLSIYVVISMLIKNVNVVFQINRINSCYRQKYNDNIVDIENVIIGCLDIISLILAYKYYIEVKSLSASISKSSSFSDMIFQYRIASVNGTLSSSISSFSSHGFEILFALSFICIYLISIHIISKVRHSFIWYVLRLIPIFSFLFCSFVAGSRNPFLQIVLGACVIVYLLLRAYYNSSRKFKFKTALKFLAVGCLVLIVFVLLKNLLGRTTQYNVLEYLAEYIAAPIKNFDTFVSKEIHNSTGIWGRETFVNVWKAFGNITGDENLKGLQMNKEFNSIKGMSLGNVYTAFREYYYDFGINGVLILTAIHSFIYTTLYLRLRKKKIQDLKKKIPVSMLIYAYMAQALFYYPIDDRFYQAYFSTGTLEYIIFLILLSFILPRLRLNCVYDITDSV